MDEVRGCRCDFGAGYACEFTEILSPRFKVDHLLAFASDFPPCRTGTVSSFSFSVFSVSECGCMEEFLPPVPPTTL